MKKVSFKQEALIRNATPDQVYWALTNPDTHATFTSAAADGTDSLEKDFSVYDGYAKGRNLELVSGKLIRQTWRSEEENWPANEFSEVIIELEPKAGSTLIKFQHNNVPEEYAEAIAQGWKDYYWKALNEYFIMR